MTRSQLIRRIKKSPNYDPLELCGLFMDLRHENKRTSLHFYLRRAIAKHPSLPSFAWIQMAEVDAVGAIQNPAWPLFLLENPSLLSDAPYWILRYLADAAYQLHRPDDHLFFRATMREIERRYASKHHD